MAEFIHYQRSLLILIVGGLSFLLTTIVQAEEAVRNSEQVNVADAAEKGKLFPRIKSAGAVFRIEGAGAVSAGDAHKVVLDVTASGPKDQVHSGLEHAARALNLYALAGVPNDKVSVAVVIHSKATPIVLSNQSYQRAFDMPNPNSDLVRRLNAAGVEIEICGQALRHHGFNAGDVAAGVNVELSAMTALEALQNQGYALIPD